MLSRNQIRQAALQYLYATSQTPEEEQEQDEGIWDILMEPFRGDYCKLRAKAVSGHLTRDYPDKLRLFVTRARETADKLQHDPLTLPVRDLLQDLLVKEGEFNASLLQLKKNLYEDPSNDKGALSAACDAAQELNTTLMQMRPACWMPSRTSLPTTASGLPLFPPATSSRKSTTASTASSTRTAAPPWRK